MTCVVDAAPPPSPDEHADNTTATRTKSFRMAVDATPLGVAVSPPSPGPARNGRDLREYRRAAANLKRTATICHLCGREIDTSLPTLHPMAWTADHLIPIAAGGHVLGPLAPAHRSCNSRKGDGRRAPQAQPLRTSQDW